MRKNAFGPLGSLSAPLDPLAAIGGGVPTSKGEGTWEGNGKREGRYMGRGKGEREGEGREGRGRTTCIPHYFRPWQDSVYAVYASCGTVGFDNIYTEIRLQDKRPPGHKATGQRATNKRPPDRRPPGQKATGQKATSSSRILSHKNNIILGYLLQGQCSVTPCTWTFFSANTAKNPRRLRCLSRVQISLIA